ncbi:DUF481 domain-containing protein [Moraxella sp. ZY210820]|uniref:DUF481 domain-containing protein n=1 Tax=unclassified Moraxella TaxID=2685852 RepID=UPI0027312C42|nr:DUF481 domain-containing protein [Moraxella sp. ZY210820]WLF83316.1 DUF481 domain-containing protein [Moraxella sp. ZY210820]
MKKITLLACLVTAVSGTAYAEAPTRLATGSISVDANKPYRLEADVGYSRTTTKNEASKSTKDNLAAHVLFQRQVGVWGQEVRASAISSHDDKSTDNTEQYYLSGKLLHRSSNTVYQFAQLTGEKDSSSAFDYQAAALAGIGFDIIKTQQQSLTAEVGAGVRHSKDRFAPKDTHNEAIGSVAAFYEYQINPMVRFNQDLGYEFGDKSRTLRSRTALSADLTKNFAAVASYNLKDVRADAGDSRTSLTSFGVRYKY